MCFFKTKKLLEQDELDSLKNKYICISYSSAQEWADLDGDVYNMSSRVSVKTRDKVYRAYNVNLYDSGGEIVDDIDIAFVCVNACFTCMKTVEAGCLWGFVNRTNYSYIFKAQDGRNYYIDAPLY